jgi:DNA-3-methyladenine glycosylase II
MLRLGEAGLRPLGLSAAKAQAILDLAARARDGRLPLDRLAQLSDEEIAAGLTAVRGIGVWTAEMFLIFGVGRLDVLPVGDLGLRAGVQERYGLEGLPGALRLREIAEPWRPYRSIATWYVWRSRGGVPQSK